MHPSSTGREASSPAGCSSSREIRPAEPPPVRRLPPAPSLCPFHPPARENSASPPPAWFSSSTCAQKTWINLPRSTARRRCPPAHRRKGEGPPPPRPPESRIARRARPFPPFSPPRFCPPVLSP